MIASSTLWRHSRTLAHSSAIARGVMGRARMKSDPLADGVAKVAAQVLYARDRECALTADGVLRRRTTLALTGRDSDPVRAYVEMLLAS
jgi:glycerol-3-phosphate dehydrogenase